MITKASLPFLLLFCIIFPALGQDKDDVVKITTNLVPFHKYVV